MAFLHDKVYLSFNFKCVMCAVCMLVKKISATIQLIRCDTCSGDNNSTESNGGEVYFSMQLCAVLS